MFYLVGLGLDIKNLSLESLEICRRAKKIYLENYTVEFPYDLTKLEGIIGKRIIPLTRMIIENESFIDEAKIRDIVLLVYGSPLIATTHISLILKCLKSGIKYKVLHNASIVDAISETGLQVYKFGKTASMPRWIKNYKPESFISLVKFNRMIKSHTLILVDINLEFPEALKQLVNASKRKFKLGKIIVCSQLGTEKRRIYYGNINELFGAEVYAPFCFIVPSELHFLEEEVLNLVKEKI